jgi:RNA polymerase sigma factor (sigma-70 family)
MTDSQHLLAEYRQNGSDAAFRELVTRYVDLVYSTALRLVEGDTHRAEDVTQTVFLDLSRKARTLPEGVQLGGWLHRDTCLVAGHTLRGERRRQSRERQAVEMNALQNHSEAGFSQVAPLLDDAINELGEADRTAILLRFFEQQDFRAVGQALGSNEDAARMRVTRALEKLEEFLKRRGVTTSAASLGVVLTANAVQAAPVGLALTISTAVALAGSTLTTAATVTAFKTIAMTTLHKCLLAATFAVVAGVGIYEARQASRLREENQSLQRLQAEQLVRERDEEAKLAGVREENERLNRNTADLLKLRAEVARLRGELKSAEQLAKNKLDAEGARPVAEQVSTNSPPVETYSATARAVVPWDQALISGGWKTPSGKVVYVLAVPTRTEDASVVKIESQVMEVSVEAATTLGLDQSNTGDKETKFSAVLTTELCDAIVKAANDTNAVAIISSPRLTVFTGRQAQIRSVDNKETRAGEKYSVGPTLTFMPTISADGQSVDLEMIANVKYPSPAANQ